MTSLSDVHGNNNRDPTGPARNRLGFLVMGFGVLLTFLGMIIGTTPILQFLFDSTVNQSQELSGVIGGTGAFTIVAGMFHSVPDKSTLETRLGRGGILLCTFGVIWFTVQFPSSWNIYNLSSMAVVGFSYCAGIMLLLGITFHAVVNYRMKSTEKFTITHRFETESQPQPEPEPEPQQEEPQGGGVGVIGNLSPEARKTYGPRNPMTKQDREKHSLKSDSNRK